jgi:hypothetical protein
LACAIDKADADTVNEGIDVILKLHVPLINQRKNISSYTVSNAAWCHRRNTSSPVVPQYLTKRSNKINTSSRVGAAGKVAQCAIPIVVTSQYDFCPRWNFQNRAGGSSQLTAGGMIMRNDPRNMNPDAETAGVIYPGPTDAAKMAAQDECEIGYTRCNIPLENIRSLNWCEIPDGITAFQYVPNIELPSLRTTRQEQRMPMALLLEEQHFPRGNTLFLRSMWTFVSWHV